MVHTSAVGADLQAKLSKAESKVKRLESALNAAKQEFDELAVTMRVLVKHGYVDNDAVSPSNLIRSAGMNESQALVYSYVPTGEVFAVAPRDVTNMVHSSGRDDLTADYIRTTLWRLAQREILKSDSGLYWRPDQPEAEKVEAPDAETPRASEELGPVTGRERGYPPSTPEGSIPSGSTPSSAVSFDTDLDDDVPF